MVTPKRMLKIVRSEPAEYRLLRIRDANERYRNFKRSFNNRIPLRATSNSARFSRAAKPFLTFKEKGYPIRGLDRSLGLQKKEPFIIF
jgi:hypothetical protein